MTKVGRLARYIKRTSMPVDISGHLESHPTPEPESIEMELGEEPAIVSPDNLVTRPYNTEINQNTRSWVKHPIQGWATIASKALFDSAGLEHMVGNVTVHDQDDEPIISHHIDKSYKPMHYVLQEKRPEGAPILRSIDPLQVQQIALMDFLLGNNDRHNLSVMVKDFVNERGVNDLMATNHSRNMQYFIHQNEVGSRSKEPVGYDSPRDYLHNSGLLEARKATWKSSPEALQEWWSDHSDNIRSTFDEQLELINDNNIAQHIRNNFDRRFTMIEKWASEHEENNYEKVGFFDKQYPHVARIIPRPRASSETIQAIREKLSPDNPIKAIEILTDFSSKKRKLATQQKIYDLFAHIFGELSVEQILELYNEYRRKKSTKIADRPLSYQILNLVYKTRNKAAAKALLTYDRGQGKVSPFWVRLFQTMLGVK